MMKFFVLAAPVSALTAVTAASVTPVSYEPEVVTDYTVAFTIKTAAPAGNTITITFPTGYAVATLTGAKIDSTGFANADNAKTGGANALTATAAAATADGTVVTITLAGTANAAANAPVTVKIPGVTNPSKQQTTAIKISTTTDTEVVAASVTIYLTGTLADGKTCEVAKQLLLAKADKCIPKSTCPAGTLKCTPGGEDVKACAADTEGATVLTADCKCGTAACKTGGKCNTTTNVCSGAFSYGFTMLAVLAAFVL